MNADVRDFRLADVLTGRLAKMGDRPRRARTRAALVAATAQEMERSGIDGLTVARIAEVARVAHGTFYLYFDNRIEAAMAVRRLYDAAIRLFRPRGGGELPPFEAIQRMNRFYVRSYANNARLLRASQFLLYARPENAVRRDRINHRWSVAILHDLKRRLIIDNFGPSGATQTMLVRSAIAMADELLREIYVFRGPSLARLAGDQEQIANVISRSWYRILYGADPPV